MRLSVCVQSDVDIQSASSVVPVSAVGDSILEPPSRAHLPGERLLVGGGLRIHHSPVVGRIGRRQVLEKAVVGRLVDPCLLATIPVVVIGIRGHNGSIVEVGGKHPGVIEDQSHHGFCLWLATSEESVPCEVFLAPCWEVSVQVLRAFIVSTSFVIAA